MFTAKVEILPCSKAPALERTAWEAPASSETEEAGASGAVRSEAGASEREPGASYRTSTTISSRSELKIIEAISPKPKVAAAPIGAYHGQAIGVQNFTRHNTIVP